MHLYADPIQPLRLCCRVARRRAHAVTPRVAPRKNSGESNGFRYSPRFLIFRCLESFASLLEAPCSRGVQSDKSRAEKQCADYVAEPVNAGDKSRRRHEYAESAEGAKHRGPYPRALYAPLKLHHRSGDDAHHKQCGGRRIRGLQPSFDKHGTKVRRKSFKRDIRREYRCVKRAQDKDIWIHPAKAFSFYKL